MKEIKTKEATVEQREYVSKVVCDICKQECKNGAWEYNDIKVEASIGSVYPECDTRTTYIIDVCKDCFLNKVITVLEKELKCTFREISTEDRRSLHE